MKRDNIEITAFAFGLAACVLLVKGLLATFWQNLPSFGYVWFALAGLFALACAWLCIRLAVKKR